MRITHTHGSSVDKKLFAVRMSSLFASPSPFSCFTRLCLLFVHGHFETNLADTLTRTILPNFADPKSAGQANSARGRAVWLLGQVRPSHIPCQDVKDRHVIFDTLPCVVISSGNRCIYGNGCDGEEKPSKKSKKESSQGAVAILREKRSTVVYLKIQIQRSLLCGKLSGRTW